MSRPSDYTQELTDVICAELASGKSLRAICREESMPCMTTVFKWLREKPEFAQQYTRAREEQADTHADEILEIADSVDEDANSRRVRVDARKWIASKLKPKKYGDKLAVGGADDLPAMQVQGFIKLVTPPEENT